MQVVDYLGRQNGDEHNVFIQLANERKFHKRQHKLCAGIKGEPTALRLDFNEIW